MATADLTQTETELSHHAKPPFLRRVRIRGYKSIAFCDVTLEPLTVLVGRNASGKSNFLDALAFLRDMMGTNITEAAQRHGGWPYILSRSVSSGEIAFELELGLEPDSHLNSTAPRSAEYGIVFGRGPSGLPV